MRHSGNSWGSVKAGTAAIAGLLLQVFALAAVSAQADPPGVPVDQRGLPIGSKVPDFRASDQWGRIGTFDSLVGPKGLVLLFVRSADW